MDAHEWNERYNGAGFVYGASANEVVVELTTPLPRGKAVDIGCGEGRNAVFLANRGWLVEGIDFSQVALDKAARLAQNSPKAVVERLTWTCADLTTADFGSGLDLALIVYIHLPPDQRRELLRRAQNALAPGGALLVLGHHSRNLDEGVGGPPDPEILFTPEDIEADLDPSMQLDFSRDLGRETEDGTAIDALVFARTG